MNYFVLVTSLIVCNLQASEGTVFHNYYSGLTKLDVNVPMAAPPGDDWVAVLVGFHFELEDDHHFQYFKLAVWGADRQLWVTLQDDSYNLKGKCWVRYAYVPPDRVIDRGNLWIGGRGKVVEDILYLYNPVFQEIQVHKIGGDMELDELGFMLEPGEPGKIEIWCNDKDDDDDFRIAINNRL